eukprot:11277253-Prorocentrum_lima.AAC.1
MTCLPPLGDPTLDYYTPEYAHHVLIPIRRTNPTANPPITAPTVTLWQTTSKQRRYPALRNGIVLATTNIAVGNSR